jgi:type IV secretory pathway VirB2 component (pilin)
MFFVLLNTQSAFADLVSGMDELQSKVKSICQPLAIIFLIVAGWQKAMGNSQLFVAALVGTVIMFASPQIVDFVSASFGR